jgi:tetratricopeptide (TPR) repeat protein
MAICPDCADAYVLLAEEANGLQESHELFRQGTEAGKRALGPEMFKEGVGQFWGLLETRPYMRARAGLAATLLDLGKMEEAATHFQELLRLNPEDNQGVRYLLGPCLLQLGRTKELAKLLDTYDEDSAEWRYLAALAVYRAEGNTPLARKRAKQALKCNRHVPDFLLQRRELPWHPSDTFRPGDEDEAARCAHELDELWHETPGATDWLAQIENTAAKKKPKR